MFSPMLRTLHRQMKKSARGLPGLAHAVVGVGLHLPALGCGSEPDEPDAGQTMSSTGSTCPDQQTLTYTSFARGFFETYCTRCHSATPAGGSRQGAPPGYNWDEIETVRAHASEIDRVAAGGPSAINTFMPPSEPRPSDDERRQLGEWLACGAP